MQPLPCNGKLTMSHIRGLSVPQGRRNQVSVHLFLWISLPLHERRHVWARGGGWGKQEANLEELGGEEDIGIGIGEDGEFGVTAASRIGFCQRRGLTTSEGSASDQAAGRIFQTRMWDFHKKFFEQIHYVLIL